MSVLKRRNRIVSFRVSQQEYEALRDTCIAQGARSISDFARSVACATLDRGNGSREPKLENTVHELRERIDELDSEVKRLTSLFEPPIVERAVGIGKAAGTLQYAIRRKEG